MRQQINSFEGHVESEVPFVLGEIDDILANGNAGAVAENVYPARTFDDGPDGTPASGGAADICIYKDRCACLRFNFRGALASFHVIDVKQGNECAHLRQAKRNPAADP